jgi:hypothetical protein
MTVQEYKQGDVVVLARAIGPEGSELPKGLVLKIGRRVANSDRYVVGVTDGPGLPKGLDGWSDGTAIIDAKFFVRPVDPEKVRLAAAAIMVAKVGGPEWLGEPAEKFVKRNEKFESPMWIEAYGLAKIALEAAR